MIKCTYIILIKNNEDFIARLIQSLKAIKDDSYKEFIFIDDASTDRSISILKSEAKNLSRCTIITEKEEQGASACINKVAKIITGDYIRFVTGDEIVHPLSTITLIYLTKKFGTEVAFGNIVFGQNTLDEVLSNKTQIIDQPLQAILLNTPEAIRNIGNSASLVTTNIFNKVGGIDNSIYTPSLSLALRCGKYSKFAYLNTNISAKPHRIYNANDLKFESYNALQSIYNFIKNHAEISHTMIPELLKSLSDTVTTNRINYLVRYVSEIYLKNMNLDKVLAMYQKELTKLLK